MATGKRCYSLTKYKENATAVAMPDIFTKICPNYM